jgi:hypothetical protein
LNILEVSVFPSMSSFPCPTVSRSYEDCYWASPSRQIPTTMAYAHTNVHLMGSNNSMGAFRNTPSHPMVVPDSIQVFPSISEALNLPAYAFPSTNIHVPHERGFETCMDSIPSQKGSSIIESVPVNEVVSATAEIIQSIGQFLEDQENVQVLSNTSVKPAEISLKSPIAMTKSNKIPRRVIENVGQATISQENVINRSDVVTPLDKNVSEFDNCKDIVSNVVVTTPRSKTSKKIKSKTPGSNPRKRADKQLEQVIGVEKVLLDDSLQDGTNTVSYDSTFNSPFNGSKDLTEASSLIDGKMINESNVTTYNEPTATLSPVHIVGVLMAVEGQVLYTNKI